MDSTNSTPDVTDRLERSPGDPRDRRHQLSAAPARDRAGHSAARVAEGTGTGCTVTGHVATDREHGGERPLHESAAYPTASGGHGRYRTGRSLSLPPNRRSAAPGES
ncbi:hypothetical protein ABT218_29710 [Streptomyces sp. NPDC001455]|uniref:hypothetical protein n=1 Tax=unclassified Streptomyces TaxID=2593676 RepID=UPI003322A4DD